MKILNRLILLSIFIISTNLLAASNLFKIEKAVFQSDTTKKIPTAIKDNSKDTTAVKKKISGSTKDTTTVKKKSPLIPLKILPLQEKILRNMTIRKNTLEGIDYRTTADFITNIPFGFVRDFGSVGQPNEAMIWGHGFGNITFLNDGLSINDRLSNALDLNLFQSESIDSIEVIPLVRGFLFGGMNNSASINFMSREININRPYSKIKFYQAPNSEGFIDGLFCITPANKLNVLFEITNQSTNSYYVNSDLSNWLGTVKLRYLLSKDLNIFMSYKYHKSEVELNGGVAVDTIQSKNDPSQFDNILYNNLQAPVRFTNRYQKVTGHNFNLRLLSTLFTNAPTDISIYYQSNLTEFRQNENGTLPTIATIINNDEAETIGANLRQDFSVDGVKLTSITNYERTVYDSPLLDGEITKTHFSETAMAAFTLFDKLLEPTFFGKYLYYSNSSYTGLGADAIIEISPFFKIFGGLSSFEKPYTVWEERFALPTINLNKQRINTFELTGSLENNIIKGTFGYFAQTTSSSLIPAIIDPIMPLRDKAIFFNSKNLSLQGVNLKLNLKIWKISLLANSSYYFSSSDRHDYNIPDLTSQGGIYYIDTLFNNNLRLKAGFNYYSTGNQDYSTTDFEKNITSNYYYNTTTQSASLISSLQFSSKVQVDFFLVGRIQKSAIVYFVYENIMGEKFFIVPYYPIQPRGMRFGIAWEFLD